MVNAYQKRINDNINRNKNPSNNEAGTFKEEYNHEGIGKFPGQMDNATNKVRDGDPTGATPGSADNMVIKEGKDRLQQKPGAGMTVSTHTATTTGTGQVNDNINKVGKGMKGKGKNPNDIINQG